MLRETLIFSQSLSNQRGPSLSTLAETCWIMTKVFAQRLTMPVSHSVNQYVKQLQTVQFWRIFSVYLCRLVDLVTVAVDE